jgi:23S rRNA (uracil1939-C5)-methyltransferase
MGGRRAGKRLVNERLETAVVHAMTVEGRGIATVAGKRVFIDGALDGETVSFRRLRARRNYDEGLLADIPDPAPARTAPRCAYFGTCGGCSLQHLSAEGQLALKERMLLDNLERIGRVAPTELLPPMAGAPWGYRRRARLAVRYVDGKGRVLVGFSERDSSRITDMRGCETLHPSLAALLGPLSELIGSLSLRQRIPQVEGVVADNAAALVVRILAEPEERDLVELRRFAAEYGVRLALQRGGPGDITPVDPPVDDAGLWYALPEHDLRLAFAPTDFIQVNADANRRLIALALRLLAPQSGMRVLDLFCGIGNFTLPLARHAGYVLGIEGDPVMVERARANARLNGIGNAEFRACDLAAEAAAAPWGSARFDAVLLDPPRAGAAAMLRPIAATGARRVLYVSCHPATLARDVGALVHELGFRLAAAGVLDMFPHTSHVEAVALLERP